MCFDGIMSLSLVLCVACSYLPRKGHATKYYVIVVLVVACISIMASEGNRIHRSCLTLDGMAQIQISGMGQD